MRRWIFIFGLLLGSDAMAQDSVTLTYQGQLHNAAGEAVTASHPITFALYNQVSGGEALWQEMHGAVDVLDGVFTVDLGSIAPISNALAQEPLLFLGVTIGDNDEMSPRIRVGGALKAQWAAVASHAQDVAGEDIHPNSVSIGDTEVINANGQWVGDASGLVGPAGPAGPAGTSPDLGLDSDLDGIVDWIELAMGTNPLDEAELPGDANADGIPDTLVGLDGSDGADGAVGPQGIAGVAGPQGPSPAHQWDGTRIRFQNPDGTWGNYVDLVGPQGVQGVQGVIGNTGNTVNLRLDSDADGFADWIEVALGTDPDDGAAQPADQNLNGIADAFETNVSGGASGMPRGETLYANYTVNNLADLAAIQQYRVIEGSLTITTADITRIHLPNLETVHGLQIESNAQVTQLDMPSLTTISGGLSVAANASLTSVVLPALTNIAEGLEIVAHSNLVEVRMPQLAAVGTDFRIAAHSSLPTLDNGFASLVSVGGSFYLAANGGLTTLGDGFSALASVGTDFSLAANGSMTTLGTSFSVLSSVGGNFSLGGNGSMESLGAGFPLLATVGGDFSLAGNGSLTSLEGAFVGLTTVTGSFDINDNDGMNTLGQGFPLLASVGDFFALASNGALESVGGGFGALTTVGGAVRLNGNHALTSYGTAFSSLQTIGTYLAIFSHDALLDARFLALETVGGHLTIGGGDRVFYSNDVLADIAFPQLTTIGGGNNGGCRRDTTQSPSGCNAQGSNSLQIYRNPFLPTCLRDYYDDVTNVSRTNGGSYVADGRDDCQCGEAQGVYTATCPEL